MSSLVLDNVLLEVQVDTFVQKTALEGFAELYEYRLRGALRVAPVNSELFVFSERRLVVLEHGHLGQSSPTKLSNSSVLPSMNILSGFAIQMSLALDEGDRVGSRRRETSTDGHFCEILFINCFFDLLSV